MNSHLKTSGGQILTHLQNAILYVFAIFCIQNIFFELIAVNFFRLCFIGKHQKGLIMMPKQLIYIDADKNLNLRNISKLFSKLKVTR